MSERGQVKKLHQGCIACTVQAASQEEAVWTILSIWLGELVGTDDTKRLLCFIHRRRLKELVADYNAEVASQSS